MTDHDRVLDALGDATRRQVMTRLGAGPASATQLAADLPMTRQAVAKHLTVLRDAGLVSPVRDGRSVRFVVEPDALEVAVAWLRRSAAAWDRRLDALDRAASERG